jgi:hypothetical protein
LNIKKKIKDIGKGRHLEMKNNTCVPQWWHPGGHGSMFSTPSQAVIKGARAQMLINVNVHFH